MNPRRATIRDVATRAAVSTATVSNVFSGTKPVNADLKERVEKAALELSYQVDRAASQLRTGQTRVIGVLVPDLDDTFFTSLISEIEVLATRDGYDVIVASSRDDVELEQSRLKALLGWRPSGIIAVPCSDTVPELLHGEVGRLPMVFADRVGPDGSLVDTVAIDNRHAGAVAARHLVELGHRDIVVAASSLAISPIAERVRGIADVMRDEIGEAPNVVELGSKVEHGANVFSRWLEGNPPPFGVIGLTNVTTLGVLSALARHRIGIPDPVSMIGFDDYPWMSARRTGLTAIRQPIDDMAARVWERLRLRMSGDASAPQRTALTITLQVRDSVRPLVGRHHGPVRQAAASGGMG